MEARVKFIDPDYRKDPRTFLFCCRCQKDIKGAHRFVYLRADGVMVVHPGDVIKHHLADDLGWHLIGLECSRRLGREWTLPARENKSMKVKKGQRVRFLLESLGASERDSLFAVVADKYGKGEEGVLAFPHPNQKPTPKGCKGWWYVEVDSKSGPARKLYVGVAPSMFEIVKETKVAKSSRYTVTFTVVMAGSPSEEEVQDKVAEAWDDGAAMRDEKLFLDSVNFQAVRE